MVAVLAAGTDRRMLRLPPGEELCVFTAGDELDLEAEQELISLTKP